MERIVCLTVHCIAGISMCGMRLKKCICDVVYGVIPKMIRAENNI